ncbi:hypothetical protein ATKI12_1355 [Kitasatospora sp. Ki12]
MEVHRSPAAAKAAPEPRAGAAGPSSDARPGPSPDGRACTGGQADVTRGGRWRRLMRAWPGLSDPWVTAAHVMARRWFHS